MKLLGIPTNVPTPFVPSEEETSTVLRNVTPVKTGTFVLTTPSRRTGKAYALNAQEDTKEDRKAPCITWINGVNQSTTSAN